MRNQTYEQVLTRQGVDWEYVERVSIVDIDTSKSLANQARLEEPIEESLVESYRVLDSEGVEFPPLVGWRPGKGKGKWILADGNHRLVAKMRNNRSTVDMYLVKCNERKIVDRISWTINNQVNGKRNTPQECMEHAITLVRKYGIPKKLAANECSVAIDTLTDKVRILEIKDILTGKGIKYNNLTEESIRRLSPLRQVGEEILCKVAETANSVGSSFQDIDDIIRDIKKVDTYEKKVKVIDDYAQSSQAKMRKAETKGGVVKVKKEPRDKYCQLIRDLRNISEDNPPDAIRPWNVDMNRYREMASSIIETFVKVFGDKVFDGVLTSSTTENNR